MPPSVEYGPVWWIIMPWTGPRRLVVAVAGTPVAVLDDADAGPFQDGEELVGGQWLGHVGALSPPRLHGLQLRKEPLAVPLAE